jgi:hypothetical protein
VTVTTYTGWVADGRPWKNCQPINDFVATLRRHGYSGPGVGIGDQAHLTANPPEDHCPYSHTPWPGVQPYPYVMAIDILANEGVDWIWLGGKLFNDKSSNVAGTQPIKYINWTDSDGNCWHDSWMPNHTRIRSTDRGHIHISFRTDYVTSTAMSVYDPFGGAVSDYPAYDLLDEGTRVQTGSVVIPTQPDPDWPGHSMPQSMIYRQLYYLTNKVDALAVTLEEIKEMIANIPGGGGGTGGNFTINLAGTATPG